MYTEDAQLSRVFTKELTGTVEDQTFAVTDDFLVVVEVEAGDQIYANGTTYSIGVGVIDYSNNATAILNITNPAGAVNAANTNIAVQGPAAMGVAPWDDHTKQIEFRVHKADIAGRVDHMCQAYAFLRAGGGTEPQVSFAVSPFFLLH